MTSIKDLIKTLPETQNDESADPGDLMQNPEYLRKSSKLMSEALRKGFDVLQTNDGDIVTTGTKIVVTRYHWDAKNQKMVKISAREQKKKAKEENNI